MNIMAATTLTRMARADRLSLPTAQAQGSEKIWLGSSLEYRQSSQSTCGDHCITGLLENMGYSLEEISEILTQESENERCDAMRDIDHRLHICISSIGCGATEFGGKSLVSPGNSNEKKKGFQNSN